MNNGRYLIRPNPVDFLTLSGVVTSAGAVAVTLKGHYHLATAILFIAMLGDALDGMLRARRTSRANDPELVGMLDSNLYIGRDMAYSAAFEDTLRALTPDMIRAAMARASATAATASCGFDEV